MIKEINRLITDVLKAIDLIRLIFILFNSQDIPVDILKIPNKGINNKSESNIIKMYKMN